MAAVRVPIIVGPTAVGKTAVALALAEHWPLEVISADSRQVYRKLDIGTAKPTKRERRRVPHHLVDLIDPGERYSAGRFARDAEAAVREVASRDRLPVIVGGTGLYIRALADGLFREPPLDPDRLYRVAVLDFLARGGDDYTMFRDAARITPDKDAPLLANEVMAYIRQVGTVRTAVDGRIIQR